MKFSVPTNWQRGLMPGIKKKKGIIELYGKLASDFI